MPNIILPWFQRFKELMSTHLTGNAAHPRGYWDWWNSLSPLAVSQTKLWDLLHLLFVIFLTFLTINYHFLLLSVFLHL